MNSKKIVLIIVLICLSSLANALTVSPAIASIDRGNNNLKLIAINTSDEDMPIDLLLGDFKEISTASRDKFNIPAKSSASTIVTFYDNVYREGIICFVEAGEE